MAFSVNTLTVNGMSLLAGASAANRLIYSCMLSSSEAMTAAAAAVCQPSDFDGPRGDIVAASATENIARVVGSVCNTSVEQVELKTFALCGRLEGDSEDVVISVLSDPMASVILPGGGGPASTTAVTFSLRISAGAAGMVEVTSAGSATLADLSRFVSLHKAGNSAEGDDQTILGDKVFKGACEFDGDLQLRRYVHIEKDIIPSNEDGETTVSNLGNAFHPFAGLNSTSAEIKVISAAAASGSEVGTSAKPFESMYAGGLMAYGGYIGTQRSEGVTGTVNTRYSDPAGGAPGQIESTVANASVSLTSDQTASGCALTVTFAASTVVNLAYDNDTARYRLGVNVPLALSAGAEGLSPSAAISDTSVTVPVGGMITLWLPNTGSGSLVGIEAGRTPLNVTASQYKTAKNSNGTWTAGDRYVPAGTYVALMDVLHSGGDAWGIFVRIA